MQVLGRATGPELGQQVHAACAGPVLIPIACAQPYLGRPVPGEDEDRHRRSSFNRRGGEIARARAARRGAGGGRAIVVDCVRDDTKSKRFKQCTSATTQ